MLVRGRDVLTKLAKHLRDQRDRIGIVLDEDDPSGHAVGLSWSNAFATFSRTSAFTCSDREYTTNWPCRSADTAFASRNTLRCWLVAARVFAITRDSSLTVSGVARSACTIRRR